jgi:hypothetical protein
MDDLVAIASQLVRAHPAVTRVEFAGSRSRGTHDELSDWDLAVETSDFGVVAHAMPQLVAPLEPLGQQWEPLGHFPAYQVLVHGPTKVEYLFLNEVQDAMPPVRPSPETLGAIQYALLGLDVVAGHEGLGRPPRSRGRAPAPAPYAPTPPDGGRGRARRH